MNAMSVRESDLKKNRWYSAYHKNSERILTVMYLGVTGQGMLFCDQERNTYRLSDFYFWKSTE